jgi:hypothetical protein
MPYTLPVLRKSSRIQDIKQKETSRHDGIKTREEIMRMRSIVNRPLTRGYARLLAKNIYDLTDEKKSDTDKIQTFESTSFVYPIHSRIIHNTKCTICNGESLYDFESSSGLTRTKVFCAFCEMCQRCKESKSTSLAICTKCYCQTCGLVSRCAAMPKDGIDSICSCGICTCTNCKVEIVSIVHEEQCTCFDCCILFTKRDDSTYTDTLIYATNSIDDDKNTPFNKMEIIEFIHSLPSSPEMCFDSNELLVNTNRTFALQQLPQSQSSLLPQLSRLDSGLNVAMSADMEETAFGSDEPPCVMEGMELPEKQFDIDQSMDEVSLFFL